MLTDVYQALADPTRREILRHLRGGDLSAGELAERFPLARSTLSGHFQILRAAGLIVSEKKGTRIVYSINESAFEEALGAIAALLDLRGPRESA